MRTLLRAVAPALTALAVASAAVMAAVRADDTRFDHWQHRKLFPTCESCHAGAAQEGKAVFPTAASCASCHDGTIEKKVRWAPRQGPARSNLRFTHASHAQSNAKKTAADSVLTCASCHADQGAPWMRVRPAVSEQCLSCHGLTGDHYAQADTKCAACHLPLNEAVTLAREDVKAFGAPESHQLATFLGRGPQGHGAQAKSSSPQYAVSQACATCHARDFCITCHVDAPEQALIQALAPDARSLAIEAKLKAPASHERQDFAVAHRKDVGKGAQNCVTCHTKESCLACHRGSPSVVRAVYAAGPGRGPGAAIERKRPANHGADFSDLHGPIAGAQPGSCAGCHARVECLDCHRPNAAAANVNGYHPPAFLNRHPAASYAQEAACSTCHNPQQFCASCHQQAGLVSDGPLVGGYHDAKQNFSLGHGPAARQSLESCVACHAERDCLTCHSALGGRRFNPHGSGFNADRLRQKNQQMCTVCHGTSIPGAPAR